MHKCENCGTEFEGNFCPECGEKYTEQKTCPQCGTTLSGNAKFCTECGYSFYESSVPAAKQPETREKSVTASVQKLYGAVSGLPAVLFGLISVLLFLFFLAPVAVMPGGKLFGETIPSENYGNVYAISNYDGMPLTGSLTMLIVFASCALFVAFLVCVLSLFSKPRYKRIALLGKPIFLRSFLTGIGYVLFFVLFLIACILLGQISNEDGGLGMFTVGAAPILTLVFTLFGCLAALVCAFVGKHLRSTYPALVAVQENKIAAAKPTAVETWIKWHKKLTAFFSVVLVVAVAVGIAVPVGLANRHNGIYYAYNGETEEYNTERYYKLSGSTWEDEDGNKGTIEFEGENVILFFDASNGMDKTGMSTMKLDGTLIDDVLKIGGNVFAKEEHQHKSATINCPCGHLNLSFELKDDGTYSIKGIGAFIGNDLIIPSDYWGIPITEIGASAFKNYTGLTSIEIPDSVTSIGDYAFSGCRGLECISVASGNNVYRSEQNCLIEKQSNTLIVGCINSVIPNGVTSIGEEAFKYCRKLLSITIPSSVTSIGKSAFEDCTGLESVTIGSGVTSIGEGAFKNCIGFTSIAIPDTVTSIGRWAFENCSGLTSITIPDSVTTIGVRAFLDCSGLESVTIGSSVTSIGEETFKNCIGLESVTIGSGVTSIGEGVFMYCSGLTSVTIPESVTEIGDSAFSDCSELTSIAIPDSVTSIGSRAFEGCDKIIQQENGVNYVNQWAIGCDKSATEIVVRSGTKGIADSAFYGCSGLTDIAIPDSVTSIGSSAFNSCSGLMSITIPDSVTSIGSFAFNSCSRMTSITIPDSVTSIGNGSFYWCSGLTSIIIPDGVTSIGSSAFSGCSGLTSIIIPDDVTSIGEHTFYGCRRLKSVFYMGTSDEWDEIEIDSDNIELASAKRYYYSAEENYDGEHWHYDPETNQPVVWTKDN